MTRLVLLAVVVLTLVGSNPPDRVLAQEGIHLRQFISMEDEQIWVYVTVPPGSYADVLVDSTIHECGTNPEPLEGNRGPFSLIYQRANEEGVCTWGPFPFYYPDRLIQTRGSGYVLEWSHDHTGIRAAMYHQVDVEFPAGTVLGRMEYSVSCQGTNCTWLASRDEDAESFWIEFGGTQYSSEEPATTQATAAPTSIPPTPPPTSAPPTATSVPSTTPSPYPSPSRSPTPLPTAEPSARPTEPNTQKEEPTATETESAVSARSLPSPTPTSSAETEESVTLTAASPTEVRDKQERRTTSPRICTPLAAAVLGMMGVQKKWRRR